jgi:hypothetical protein
MTKQLKMLIVLVAALAAMGLMAGCQACQEKSDTMEMKSGSQAVTYDCACGKSKTVEMGAAAPS